MSTCLVCFVVALHPLGGVAGTVRINEFMASNGSTLADEDGDFEDWIELVNVGGEAVNLQGWGLSDDADDPFRWTFPDTVLPPGAILLVWASGKDRAPEDEPVSPIAPDELPGLTGWFRADALQGLAEGDPVSTWPDSSGLGNDAFQEESARQPRYRAEVLNGLPGVGFDGAGHQFNLPRESFVGMETFDDFTFLALVRWDGGVVSGLWGTGPSNDTSGNVHFEVTSGGGVRLRVAGMNGIQVSGAMQPGWNWIGASQRSEDDEPVARVFLNAAVIGTRHEDTGDSTLAKYGGFFLGNSHDSSRNFDGVMAEVLVYNRALEPEERRGLERYLAEKYAFTPSSSPQSQPQLHTSFRISSAGEALLLTRPDGTRADEVGAVEVPRDTSFGRAPDGGAEWVHYLEPTPGASNTSQGFAAPLDPPGFSRARGFYASDFWLELTHADSEASLYYTLDGSPPDEEHGRAYSGPIPVSTTAVVRAMAVKEGALPVHRVMTHSYVFLADVIRQSDDPAELGFPDRWGGWEAVHYGMNPEITEHPDYQPRMIEAMTSIPTLSLVMDMDDMFDADTGVYANRTRKGYAWERPVSVELMHPDGTTPGFQVNAGIRSQGGASRQVGNTPKGSLRLLFKSEYEARRLEFPFFLGSGSAMDDFNTITLRAEYNNEWLHWAGGQRNRGQYMRDRFIRDSQVAMTGAGSRSNHVHLYINGVYWGLYNPSERIDAAFGATYFGGEREDWDAVTHRGVRDGNRQAWDAMRAIANGGLASLESYEAIQAYLDVPQYTDYILLNLWAGMHDWPHNNWNAIRRREPGAGYMFFCWDSERSMEGLDDNRVHVSADAAQFFAALRTNPEYRLLFGDHVHRHLFNEGALTAARALERYRQTAAAVEAAVIAESARWGSYRRDKHCRGAPCALYTRNDHWQAEYERLVNDYLPHRTAIVVQQFRNAGLYPQVDAPVFTPHGGALLSARAVSMDAPQGVVYYTTNGEDPRQYGTGEVSGHALLYEGPLTLEDDVVLRARVYHEGEWSALNEVVFAVPPVTPHPLAAGPYLLGAWDPEAPAGTYPAHMMFEQVQEGDPGLTTAMDGYWTLPYNLTSRSRVVGLDGDGVGFINTGNAQDVEGAGYVGSALLALDTTGETNLRVQWTGGTVLPNERVYGLRLQARVGAAGTFRDVLDAQGRPVEYLRNETPGHSEVIGPVTLPESLENHPYVELRWKYYHVLGDSGPRAMLRLDNLVVTSFAGNGPSVRINEAMPLNESTFPDEDGAHAGWVELHNYGTEPVALAGFGLSPDPADPLRWTFPENWILEPGAYLLVWASGKDRRPDPAAGTELHANFTLPHRHGRLRLSMPDGMQVDELSYAYVPAEASIGRRESVEWFRFANREIQQAEYGRVDSLGYHGNGAVDQLVVTAASPTTTLFVQDFEDLAIGAGPSDFGWRSGAEDQSQVMAGSYDDTGGPFPLPESPRTKVLQLETGGSTLFADVDADAGAYDTLQMDQMVNLQPVDTPSAAVLGDPGTKLTVFLDGAGRPMLFHGGATGNDHQLTRLSGQFETDAWHRLTIPVQLAGAVHAPGGPQPYFQVVLNGQSLSSTDDTGSGADAPWVFFDEPSPGVPNTAIGYDQVEDPDPQPPGGVAVFLPGGDGDWDEAVNWSTGEYPDGSGKAAWIGPPQTANRNVDLRSPVTIGRLTLDNQDRAHRNRVRVQDGAALTFAGDDAPAELLITGSGTGFAEFSAGGFELATDLVIAVNHLNAQHGVEGVHADDYGALRLRNDWTGTGGLVKTGPGVMSLTGPGKDYTGPTTIAEGVLRVTEPAVPRSTAGVAVEPGGQLRLVSGGDRVYPFGGMITLAGSGRDEDVEGEPPGAPGALRYYPGSNGNRAELPNAVHFADSASLHVDGTDNRLALGGVLTGAHGFTKSGGGTLVLTGASADYTSTVDVRTGVLQVDGLLGSNIALLDDPDRDSVLRGTGRVGAVSGAGIVAPGPAGTLTAGSVDGLHYRFTVRETGMDLLRLTGSVPFANALDASHAVKVFLDRPDIEADAVFDGGFFTDTPADFAAAVAGATWTYHVPAAADEPGDLEHDGQAYAVYSAPEGWQLRTVAAVRDVGAGLVTGRVVRIGAPAATASAMQAWADNHFTADEVRDPETVGPLADPDETGIPNLLRFALGLGRFDAFSDRLLSLAQEDGLLLFRYRRLAGEDHGVDYLIEISADLVDATAWRNAKLDVDLRVREPIPHGDGTETAEYAVPSTTLGEPRFYRVRVRLEE